MEPIDGPVGRPEAIVVDAGDPDGRRIDPHTGNEVGDDVLAVADHEGYEFCLVTRRAGDRG